MQRFRDYFIFYCPSAAANKRISVLFCSACCPHSRLKAGTHYRCSRPVFTVDVFTALHKMQMRSSDENSVGPSVCLSVCQTTSMTLNDPERHNSPYFAFFFTEFDTFAGRLCHSG